VIGHHKGTVLQGNKREDGVGESINGAFGHHCVKKNVGQKKFKTREKKVPRETTGQRSKDQQQILLSPPKEGTGGYPNKGKNIE